MRLVNRKSNLLLVQADANFDVPFPTMPRVKNTPSFQLRPLVPRLPAAAAHLVRLRYVDARPQPGRGGKGGRHGERGAVGKVPRHSPADNLPVSRK